MDEKGESMYVITSFFFAFSSRHGPPRPCCLFDCVGWRELFLSNVPKRSIRSENFGDVHAGSSKPQLNESFATDDRGDTPISESLLAAVRDVASMNKELEKALDASDSDRVQALLNLGANPDHYSGSRKETPLITACFNQDLASIQYLLKAQADPNKVIPGVGDQITPLMIAAEHGMHEAVAELIKFNADPHKRSQNGDTALLAAARTNNHDAFALLVGSIISQPTSTF